MLSSKHSSITTPTENHTASTGAAEKRCVTFDLCKLDTTELAQVMGGDGPATTALNAVIDWIAPEDGSLGEALEATAKSVIAWPLVGTLALWSYLEHEIGIGS